MPPTDRGRGRIVTGLVWAPVIVCVAWALVRLLGLEPGFPLVSMLAFTPWVALASLIPLGLAVALRRWAAGAVAGVVCVVFAALVIPRAIGGGGGEVADGVPLRVLSANMKLGRGDPAALAELAVALDADVISVQELTPKLAAKLGPALRASYPHSVLSVDRGSAGGGIYAAPALRDLSGQPLPGGFPSPQASIALGGAPPLALTSVHTLPPTSSPGTASWREDLEALPGATDTPLRVLAGDFNATLDHAELRALIDRGYVDAADAEGAGLKMTWPSHRRFPPLVAIDHVLADQRIEINDFSVHDLPGSDHRAVFAALELPRSPQ